MISKSPKKTLLPCRSPRSAPWLLAIGVLLAFDPDVTRRVEAQDRASSTSYAQQGFTQIQKIQDVLSAWSPERHLYVKGNVGASASQLGELEAWLAQNGPHWTVVLVDNADGEYFVAADGRPLFGIDAVEVALGMGLSNQTKFGELVHPLTHETDGAIFVLMLKNRKFSYFGSEAQDRRGLGESHWFGELDQPAVRAMRSGGRVLDAVRDTVKSINQRLERIVQAETETARNAELEQQRDFQTATEAALHLREVYDQVQEDAKAFRESNTAATGQLANPPLPEWKARLDELASQTKLETASNTLPQLRQLATELDQYLNGYAAVRGYPEHRKELEGQVAELVRAPNSVASGVVTKARKELEFADVKFRNGDLDLIEQMRGFEPMLREADQLIDAEKKRIEEQTKFRRMVRQVIATISSLFGLLLAGILWFFHRKRKPAMDQAVENLKQREESVAKETEGLDQLFTQSGDLLGSRERIKERGYTGKTKSLGEGTLGDIDDLFIMSKEARRVIGQAKDLVYPPGVWEKIINNFSAGPYEESIRQLSGKPLKFNKSTGIPTIAMEILRERALETGEEPPKEVPDEVVMTFDEIFQAIQGKRKRASETLKVIDYSLTGVNDELDRCQSELQKMVNQERRLSELAQDNFFPVPSYFEALIPSIQKDLAEAESLSTHDAVSAMQGPAQSASWKLAQGMKLGSMIAEYRGKYFDQLKTTSEALRAMGYTTHWIDADLHEQSKQANELFEKATTQSIADQIDAFGLSMDALQEKAKKALSLAKHLKEQTEPKLSELPGLIKSNRGELAKSLRLPEDKVLIEGRFNPDDAASMARKNLEAASTLLLQGKVEACQAALTGCEAEVDKAKSWMDASKATVKEFDQTLRLERSRLDGMLERCRNLLGTLRNVERDHTSAALRLSYSVVEEPAKSWAKPGAEPLQDLAASEAVPAQANPTQANTTQVNAGPGASANGQQEDQQLGGSLANQLLQRAESIAQQVSKMHNDAQAQYSRGEVLGAISTVREASALIAEIDRRLVRVEVHLQHLERCVVENQQQLETCAAAAERLLESQNDRLVMFPTIRQIQEFAEHVGQVQSQVATNTQRTNPFELAQVLMHFQKRIAELEAMIVADHQGHAEASRAVDGAVRQWSVARQYVQQSRTDNIPDSPATKEGVRRVDVLEQGVLGVQQQIEEVHGDWHNVGRRAAEVQSDLANVSKKLSQELQMGNDALQEFQRASESVYNAEHWTGPWGMRIDGSPGVRLLESARSQLQAGNYASVLELSSQANQAAQIAIQRVEREVQKRRIDEQQRAERLRRERMAAEAARTGTIILGGRGPSSSGGSIFGSGGTFGGGGPFGGGGGGGSFGGGGGGVSNNNSGFGRSGW